MYPTVELIDDDKEFVKKHIIKIDEEYILQDDDKSDAKDHAKQDDELFDRKKTPEKFKMAFVLNRGL